jgi:hypothetical protein
MAEIPEMVECVARAMFEADPTAFTDEGRGSVATWDESYENERDQARFYARVAIKAMCKPTAEMLDRATELADWWLGDWFKDVGWPRAIAGALGEK